MKYLLIVVCAVLGGIIGAWIFWNFIFIPSIDTMPRGTQDTYKSIIGGKMEMDWSGDDFELQAAYGYRGFQASEVPLQGSANTGETGNPQKIGLNK